LSSCIAGIVCLRAAKKEENQKTHSTWEARSHTHKSLTPRGDLFWYIGALSNALSCAGLFIYLFTGRIGGAAIAAATTLFNSPSDEQVASGPGFNAAADIVTPPPTTRFSHPNGFCATGGNSYLQ